MKTGNIVLGVVSAFVLTCQAAFAAAVPPEASSGERILQQELKQQQIQRTTQRLGEQLASIVAEFERNGIAGEDLKVLRAINLVLGRLSEREMREVVTLLQQARTGENTLSTREHLAGAYSGQKSIITQLKQLILEYERQQALYELSIRFREMAARQGKNMRAGRWLVRGTDLKSNRSLNDEQKLALNMQQMDQVNIRDETQLLVNRLGKLAAESDGTATGERPQAAARQAQEGGLMPALDAAIEALKAGKLVSATGDEKKARDQMREVARLLLMSKDLLDLLRAAIRETEAAIMLQKQVIQEVPNIEKREDGLLIEDHQFEVVDNTDLIRRDINDIAPVAAGYFRTAIDRMQEARELLSNWESPEKKRAETPLKQNEAVTNLELAKRALQEQLAKAEEEAYQPENTLAQLKDLQEQVQDLIQDQEKLKEETAQAQKKPQELRAKAPAQGDLKDRTQDAQQQAADIAPSAAQALDQAANEMDESQKALARSQNDQDSQQSAIDSLKDAEKELGKEIARLEEAAQELAGLEKLSEKVGQLIQEQEKVNLQTAKEAMKPTPSHQTSKDLSQKEQDLARSSGEAQQEAEQSAPSAAPHLAEAQSQMNQASDHLAKPDPNSAQAPEKKALNELFAAKKEIDDQISQLEQELGLASPVSDSSLADALAALEKAEGEVNQAMAQMGNAPPGLLDSLAKQQREIASALANAAQESPSPQVNQAQQAASHAADQLTQGELQEAIGSMQKAQDAIQQAAPTGEAGPPGPPAQREPGQSGEQSPAPSAQAASSDPGSDEGTPALPQIAQRQAEVQQQAEALLAAQQAVPPSAMQAAAGLLSEAASDVTPVAAGEMGPLPITAQLAVQAALESLNSGAAQASANQQAPAQASAADAAQALARAQAALALAQAGLSSEMAAMSPAQPGQSGQPAQGQQPGQGQQAGQTPGQGQQPGQQPGRGTPPPRGTGQVGNWYGSGGANGPHRNTTGSGSFVTLPQRDRAAIQQSQSEKYPQEYGPMVEQYFKNLSDDAGEK